MLTISCIQETSSINTVCWAGLNTEQYSVQKERIQCWAQYRTKQAVHSPAVAIAAREPSWCQSALMLTLCIFGMTEVTNIITVGNNYEHLRKLKLTQKN